MDLTLNTIIKMSLFLSMANIVLLLLLGTYLMLKFKQLNRHEHDFYGHTKLIHLKQNKTANKLSAIQENIHQLIKIVRQLTTTERAYTKAISIMQNGGSIDDIIKYCDISHSEAELISAMHAQNTTMGMDNRNVFTN